MACERPEERQRCEENCAEKLADFEYGWLPA
jgi:hypothetical protein